MAIPVRAESNRGSDEVEARGVKRPLGSLRYAQAERNALAS